MSTESRVVSEGWTIGRLLKWTSGFLERHRIDDPRLSAEVLLAHATQLRRIDLYARPDEVPSVAQVERFRDFVRRAAAHEPIAYLVGEKEFLSLAFYVTPDVLIPRPESETLVEAVVDFCRSRGLRAPRLFDMGTGSGCLAVAVLTQLGDATVVAGDVSQAALDVAAGNAGRHGVSDRFTPVLADRLAIPKDAIPAGGFDVLMSNPPYVARDEMGELDVSVREYEPALALTDDADGLSFYRTLREDGSTFVAPHGGVIVEVGDGQAEAVGSLMAMGGAFELTRTVSDAVTRRARVLVMARVT